MNIHAKKFTDGGKPFVALPEAEFEKIMEMLEDMEDILDARKAIKAINDGEETIPAQIAYKLMDAKNSGQKIKIWREYRGLSKVALGESVGIAGQYIGMIEAGKRQGTIDILAKIALALDCMVDDLI